MSPKRLAKLLGWLGSAVLAAVLVATVWVVRHRTSLQALTEAARSVIPGALLSARDFHWTQMKGDQKQWELAAREASFSDDKRSLRLNDAELSMLADDGRHVSVHAPRAELRIEGSRVRRANLSGGIEVHYGAFLLTAARAAFSPDNDELEVPGLVRIEGQGFRITGVGLTAHPRAQLFDLHKQVSTQVTPSARAVAGKLL